MQDDGVGGLVAALIEEESTRYWSDGTEELEETSLDGQTLRKRYTYGTTIDEVCRMDIYNAGVLSTSFYYHTNHQGTVYTMTDTGGVVMERYEFDEYGNIRTTTDINGDTLPGYASQIGNEYLFQGRRYDQETNLYYYRARFYDPAKGRFITRDPKGYIDGLNMYAFVLGNPVNMTDPTGTITDEQAKEMEESTFRRSDYSLDEEASEENQKIQAQENDVENKAPKSLKDLFQFSLDLTYAKRTVKQTVKSLAMGRTKELTKKTIDVTDETEVDIPMETEAGTLVGIDVKMELKESSMEDD